MIFIVVKTKLKPGCADAYMEAGRSFLEATRQEPGNKWFEYYRSVEDPDTVVLLEAFDDEAAGEAHVNSEHFKTVVADSNRTRMHAEIPDIMYINMPDKNGWDKMAEVSD